MSLPPSTLNIILTHILNHTLFLTLVHSKPKTTSVMRSPPLSFVSSQPFVFPDHFSRAEGPLPVCGVAEPAPGPCTTRINRVRGERSCDARNVRWRQCTVLYVRPIIILAHILNRTLFLTLVHSELKTTSVMHSPPLPFVS